MHIRDAHSGIYCNLFSFPGEMGPDFSSKMAVKSLTSQQIVRIHQLFRQAKFDDPSGHVSDGVFVISTPFYIFHYSFPHFFLLYIPYFCHLICPSYVFSVS